MAAKKAKRTKAAQAERDAWAQRRPWPVCVLGIDPGSAVAGAALIAPRGSEPRVLWARSVDPYTRALEHALLDAVATAEAHELQLVLGIEEWGRGGPMGIEQWLGLGAAKGHWLRAARLFAADHPDGPIVASRVSVNVHVGTWRSWMEIPVVVRDEQGGSRRNEPDDWKRHATRRLSELEPDLRIDSADAAEAALIGLYVARCDELGRKLPKRLLARHGLVAA